MSLRARRGAVAARKRGDAAPDFKLVNGGQGGHAVATAVRPAT